MISQEKVPKLPKYDISDRAPTICGWYISHLYRSSGSRLALELKKMDLSPSQSMMLVGIYRNEGVNQQTLCDLISVLPSVASRALRELEDKGCIIKKRDEENRRNYNLYLTPSGRDLTEKSLMIQEKYWNRLLKEFTPEEVDTLNQLLARMERQASQD